MGTSDVKLESKTPPPSPAIEQGSYDMEGADTSLVEAAAIASRELEVEETGNGNDQTGSAPAPSAAAPSSGGQIEPALIHSDDDPSKEDDDKDDEILPTKGDKNFGSAQYEDDTIDYFGDLEGANVDELELSPRKDTSLKRAMMIRQASDVSEASLQISSTPEAESYFQRKTDLLQDKALRGDLDIQVTGENISEGIEIFNLSDDPVLTVKDAMSSSFENLYDKCRDLAVSGAEDYSTSNRGSFHATYNVPERVSSFENLYNPEERTSLMMPSPADDHLPATDDIPRRKQHDADSDSSEE